MILKLYKITCNYNRNSYNYLCFDVNFLIHTGGKALSSQKIGAITYEVERGI